jgi:hypothetical protein
MATITVKTPLGTVSRDAHDWELKENNFPEGVISRAKIHGFDGTSSDSAGLVHVPATLVCRSLIYIRK